MDTKFRDMSEREAGMPAGLIRNQNEEGWISFHASGSLQKARRLGFSYRSLYLEERTAHEFGWGFRIVPKSRIIFGDAMMEGDCSALTETCWHASRIISRNPFPDSDEYQVKYIKVYETDVQGETTVEGVGLVVRQTSASWIPAGYIVYSIVAEWKNNQWREAQNPC